MAGEDRTDADRLEALTSFVATGDRKGRPPPGFPGDALARECAPVLAALREDAGLERHETAALLVLLGRRTALMGLEPLHLARLGEALAPRGARTPEASGSAAPLPHAQWALLLEGYVQGRDEALRGAMEQALATSQPMARWAPGCLLWCLCGPLPAESVERCGEHFARLAHRQDTVAAVLDLQGAPPPTEGRGQALAHTLELLRTTGCEPLLSRPSGAWHEALGRQVGGPAPRAFASLQDAMVHAEALAGLKRLPWPPWRRPGRRPASG